MAGRGRIQPELATAWLEGFDPASVSPDTHLLARELGYDLGALAAPPIAAVSTALGALLDTVRKLESDMRMPADLDNVEGRRFLLRMLSASIDLFVEEGDVDHPRFHHAESPTRKMFADQKLLIDNIADGVRVIRERTDDTNVRIASLREELEALRTTVQAIQQMALAPPPPPPVDPSVPLDPSAPALAPAPAQPPAALPPSVGLSPTRLYETARADYFAGQWTSAINGFEAFLRAFPRSEQADDAQLYIGETYYAQNQWTQAIMAYTQAIESYPGTNSVPIAYYKRGLAQQQLGQVDAARASWEAAAKMFPDSDAGRLARQNLDRLASQPTAPAR
jgi:tol-pal system protein YbgF